MKITLPFNYQLRVYFSRLERRTGICSQSFEIPDRHILLWDFDDTELSDIQTSLRKAQKQFSLPEILIVESSSKNYHAYCFALRSLKETISILASVPQIDMAYLRLGIARGYFTLRITSRENDNFKLSYKLESKYPQESGWWDMTVNEYLTSNKGGKNNA